jgi:three-Cys-motif partner protein
MTQGNNFFEEPTQVSRVKTEIVKEYFEAWRKIILKRSKGKLMYLDLFAGKGKYEDGSESTPIVILKIAMKDSELRSRLITIFNDKNSEYVQQLSENIFSIPSINLLSNKPKILNFEVDEEISRYLESLDFPPTISFIDPFGYKGVSIKLIRALIKGWGCECIIFFNYNRINPALDNPLVNEHMIALFGESRVRQIQIELAGKPPGTREKLIIEYFIQVLKELGVKFTIEFRFRDKRENRTSHYLFFTTKNQIALNIMKDIMNKIGTRFIDGMNCFEYSPIKSKQTELIFSPHLKDLIDVLPISFAGQEVTMDQVFLKHHVGTRYVKRDYKDALLRMDKDGTILTEPPREERREGTFGDNVRVKFPEAN